MKKNFTQQEVEEQIKIVAGDYDIVRLVSPAERKVLFPPSEVDRVAYCHELLGRNKRCENCTSMRALQSKGQYYKIDFLNKRILWVESRYLCVDGRDCVEEKIKDITDTFVFDSDERTVLGDFIKHYNIALVTDPLTGVYNRRFLEEDFLPSFQCCQDPNINVGVAFFDVDNFKRINDTYGHVVGDEILKRTAQFWKARFNCHEKGKERFVVRFGGDEFLIVAVGLDCGAFAKEITEAAKQIPLSISLKNQTAVPYAYALGTACSCEVGPGLAWTKLVALADQRMYANKPVPPTGGGKQ